MYTNVKEIGNKKQEQNKLKLKWHLLFSAVLVLDICERTALISFSILLTRDVRLFAFNVA